MKFKNIFFAGFATVASMAHGQGGYWEARMLPGAQTNGVAVVRIGEAAGVMSRTGEAVPEIVVVANTNGWVSIAQAGEFPRDVAPDDPGRKGTLVMRFWGRPETKGRVETHVVLNGEFHRAPEFEWTQARGWQAPENAEEARWNGDLELLALETSTAEWHVFEVAYKRSGTLLMVK